MRSRHTRLFAGSDRDSRPPGGAGVNRLPFDPEAIRLLATILVETGLTEIEISEKDSRIRIARTPAPVTASLPAHPAYPPPGAAPLAAGPLPAPETEAVDDAAHPGAVLSPMVGVVYLSGEPGTPP